MVLLDIGIGLETVDGCQIRESEDGVTILKMEAHEFDGEHSVRSVFYIWILWLVSIWAMTTNFIQALYIKIFKRRTTALGKIIWDMGRDENHISSTFVDRFSRFNHQAKFGAAGWRSLDLFYNYYKKVKPQLDGNLEDWLTRYWIGKMENRQAVANRLKIVVDLLERIFAKFINEPEIRLISIASGSAQAVIEAIQRHRHLNVKVVLIDIDKLAMEEAGKKVKEAGLENHFTFIHNATQILEKVCSDFHPHIVEMIGFLDYRPKEKAIRLIKRIKNCLPTNGIFLTCNIRKNREKPFLDWVLLWPMIYRSERQFADLFLQGGFSSQKIDIIYEPFQIHGIGVCQK